MIPISRRLCSGGGGTLRRWWFVFVIGWLDTGKGGMRFELESFVRGCVWNARVFTLHLGGRVGGIGGHFPGKGVLDAQGRVEGTEPGVWDGFIVAESLEMETDAGAGLLKLVSERRKLGEVFFLVDGRVHVDESFDGSFHAFDADRRIVGVEGATGTSRVRRR